MTTVRPLFVIESFLSLLFNGCHGFVKPSPGLQPVEAVVGAFRGKDRETELFNRCVKNPAFLFGFGPKHVSNDLLIHIPIV